MEERRTGAELYIGNCKRYLSAACCHAVLLRR